MSNRSLTTLVLKLGFLNNQFCKEQMEPHHKLVFEKYYQHKKRSHQQVDLQKLVIFIVEEQMGTGGWLTLI